MFNKRFLVPVLALVAFGMTASADTVAYCNTGCGVDTTTQFTTDLATDSYTLAALAAFASGNLSGGVYTDPTTGIIIYDYQGYVLDENDHNLSVNGSALSDGVNQQDTIVLEIPSTYLAVEFTATAGDPLCISSGPCISSDESSGVIGFINPSPGGTWTVSVGPAAGETTIQISNLSAATAGVEESETPEVGTLLLIGSGLVAMRWMRRVPRRIFTAPQTA